MATGQEVLAIVDEIDRELGIYDGAYKPIQEQTALTRCRDFVDKLKALLFIIDPDGVCRFNKLSPDDWEQIASLMAPLARCFLTSPAGATGSGATSKTRHASATAVATLASISTCNQAAKVILVYAVENGVVAAFVNTLRHSLRNPNSDRVIRAVLYKCIETFVGLTLLASTEQQALLVGADVVDVCLELVTSGSVEPESKLLANKTLHNVLSTPGRVVSALRASKVHALNAQLQQLAAQVPEPAAAAVSASGGGGGAKAISLPVLLPSIMNWIWFLPDYILDHLMDSLLLVLSRVIVLVWPEGAPGIPVLDPNRPADGDRSSGGGDGGGGAVLAGPLQCAQQSLPNRSFRQTLGNLFAAIAAPAEHGADPRLIASLRGAHLPVAAAAGGGGAAAEPGAGLALPARLVRVVCEGRADDTEVKVALELLEELLGACEAAGRTQLADDALEAGLLGGMSQLAVFAALRTEAGVAGLSAYVRLATRLVKRAASSPRLAAQLREGGVPASVAYMAFWPGGKGSLKLEALQALHEMVQLDGDMTDAVAALPNFPVALSNALLGGDPDTRKPVRKPAGGGKRRGAASAAAAAAAGAGAAGAAGAGAESSAQAARTLREQMQDAAFNILIHMLEAARERQHVWRLVLDSGLLPRLLQHCPAFPMQPRLLGELLAAMGLTLADHTDDHTLAPAAAAAAAEAQDDAAGAGAGPLVPLQAALAPHVLPLLGHEESVVAVPASRLMLAILEEMARCRRSQSESERAVAEAVLQALVAAAPAIDTADEVAAAAATATAAAAAAPAAGAAGGEAAAGAGAGASAVAGTGGPAAGVKEEVKAEATAGPAGADDGGGLPAKVDVDAAPAAARPAGPAPAGAAAGGRRSGGGKDSGGAGAEAEGAERPEVPELIDVTAQGLGLICAAMQSCLEAMTGRQQQQQPEQQHQEQQFPASGVGTHAAAAEPPTLTFDGAAADVMQRLLACAAVLAEAGAALPAEAPPRRHLCRALAYARPAAAELAAALEASLRVRGQPGELHACAASLRALCGRVLGALAALSVLDVALLPKPKPEELEEAKDAPAPTNGGGRRGRAPGSTSARRAAQTSIAAIAGQPGAPAQSQQPPAKRQRTATAAAAAAAAQTEETKMRRSRSSTLVAAEAQDGDAGATGRSPRIAARRAASNTAAAAAAAAAAGGAGFAASDGLADPSLPAMSAHAADGAVVATAAGLRPGKPGLQAGGAAVKRPKTPVPAGQQVGRDAAPLPPMQLPPLPSKPHPPGAPGAAARVGPAAHGGSRSESPSTSLDNGDVHRAGAAGGATGAASAAAGSRLTVTELKARYNDLKAQNAKLASELQAARSAAAEAEAARRVAEERLAGRTREVEELLEALGEANEQLAAREEEASDAAAAARGTAAAAAQAAAVEEAVEEAVGERDARIAELLAQLREARQEAAEARADATRLRGENEQLRQELDELNDVEL